MRQRARNLRGEDTPAVKRNSPGDCPCSESTVSGDSGTRGNDVVESLYDLARSCARAEDEQGEALMAERHFEREPARFVGESRSSLG